MNLKRIALWVLLGIAAFYTFNSLFSLVETIGETIVMALFHKPLALLSYNILFGILYPLAFTLVFLPLVKKKRDAGILFPSGWFIALLVCWPVLQLLNAMARILQGPLITHIFNIEEISAIYQFRAYSGMISSFIPTLTVVIYGIIFISGNKLKDDTALDANIPGQ